MSKPQEILNGLPVWTPWPWMLAFEADGWFVECAFEHATDGGYALLSRDGVFALGRWDARDDRRWTEAYASEGDGKRAFNRLLPPTAAKFTLGN